MRVGWKGVFYDVKVLLPILNGTSVCCLFLFFLKIPLVLDTKGFMQPKKPIVLKMVPRAHGDLQN